MPLRPPVALSIAGFDPSNGAGITADLAVFSVFGLFGTSAITTKTVQSTRGVAGREDSSAEHLQAVLACLEEDLPASGIKIGALGNGELVRAVGEWLRGHKKNISTVWDPALISTSGAALLDVEGLSAVHEALLPELDWITPNWSELATLSGFPVASEEEVEAAATSLMARYPRLGVIATGGDQAAVLDWLFLPDGSSERFAGERVESTSTHGTGCAFSSAFLAGMMLGRSPRDAVRHAKAYVAEAIRRAPGVGSGRGPLALYWPLSTSSSFSAREE